MVRVRVGAVRVAMGAANGVLGLLLLELRGRMGLGTAVGQQRWTGTRVRRRRGSVEVVEGHFRV